MSAGVPRVLPDANVLYARTLRDWICLLAFRSGPPLFHLRWTEDILAELLYHLRKNNPDYSDKQIGGVREAILRVAHKGRISGYEINPSLSYTDKYDAHLHAAAEHGDVQYVVTDDRGFLKFAEENDDTLNYEVYTTDDFLMLVAENSRVTVYEVLLEQVDYFRRRGGAFNLSAALENAGAPQFAQVIRQMMQSPTVAEALTRPVSAKP